jgi:TRAP-type mannitol/chloroaromatic compound transport system permease small subunit
MEVLSRRIDALNDKVGRICSFFAFILMFIVLFEVISRRVFNQPTIWTFEVISWLYGVHFMMALPYTLLHKAHVNVDLVVGKLTKRQQAYMVLITYCVFFFPFVIGLLLYSINFSVQSWVELEHSWSSWSPPLYYIKSVLPVTFLLLFLQGVSEMIKTVSFLKEEVACE